MSIRTLIADDDEAVRASVRDLLAREPDIRVIGEAEDGRIAVALASQLAPDIAVLDVSMPGMSGIQAAAKISRNPGGARVIGLSMHDDPGWVRQMIGAGARGYVLKETAVEELAAAVRAVVAGDTYFSRGIAPMSLPGGEQGDASQDRAPNTPGEGDDHDH